jgi:hypothetical protein
LTNLAITPAEYRLAEQLNNAVELSGGVNPVYP